MCEKKALLPKKLIFGTNAPSKQGGFRGGRSPTLKPKKVTLFTMVLCNLENNTSKPTPNKISSCSNCHCSRYMAILSSVVLSQQCSEVYTISSCSSEAVMKLTTIEISSGVFKGRRARHLPWAPLFGGPPLRCYACKYSLFLMKNLLFTHMMYYKADHKKYSAFKGAPYRNRNV